MTKTVIKRDGRNVAYDRNRITNALKKAILASSDKEYAAIAEKLSSDMETELAGKFPGGVYHVEDIQDLAEKALMSHGLYAAAKAFIRYRAVHENVRNVKSAAEFCEQTITGYTGEPDATEFLDPGAEDVDSSAEKNWHVKQNASVSYSVGAMILNNSERISKAHWLSKFYDEEIVDAYKSGAIHIHDLGMLTGYCAGWDLKKLIKEGLGGVKGKISSGPAKHLYTLCNQMVNFLGIMQNEWAGAQAFSSFDTYLAPFVKKDNLNYAQVRQCIQSFVFGVNIPSRWGCVDAETEVLTTNGFKKYNEIREGDNIYTWNDGRLEINPVRKIIIKPWVGKMHSYKGRGYNQTVNPEHRVLYRKYNSNEYAIKHSDEIFGAKTAYALPVKFRDSEIQNDNLTDPMIILAAMVYTDGSFDYRMGKLHKVIITKSPNRFGNEELEQVLCELGLEYTKKQRNSEFGTVNNYVLYGDAAKYVEKLCGDKTRIHRRFMTMSQEQAELFLTIWSSFDGDEDKRLCQYDNDTIRDQLQQIAILSGHCSYIRKRLLASGKTTNYVKIRQVKDVYPTEREEFDYAGIVWCPNVENGTAVFRKDGCVYISGQCQAPFSNITLDWTCPEDLKNLPAVVGGEEQDFTYGDCEKEMEMVNKAFIETMVEGDCNGRGFAYPIPTYSITKDFDWSDTENNRLLFEMAAKYGTPYFSNYVNSDMKPSDVRSMCCRLRLDLRELRKQNGGNFGAGENTGSIGVVTINMPRIAYLSENEDEFFKRLTHMMDVSARSLDIKRRVINKYMDMGLYPYTRRYLPQGFTNHFSTIGLVGMNEACLNAKWIHKDMTHKEAYEWSGKVLDFMREKLKDYQELYGNLFNLEATPAESTAYRLAMHDRKLYPDIITAGKPGETPYYTNSSHLPVGSTDDVFEALDIQDDLQTKYTSGTVFHCFLGEKLPSWKSAMQLVETVTDNYRLPYFTLSPVYSVCEEHGYLKGEQKVCPYCGKPTEVYSRITGYYRPVSNWNAGKLQEYEDRKAYTAAGSYESAKRFSDSGRMEEAKEVKAFDEKNVSEEAYPQDKESSPRLLLFTTPTCPNCKMLKARGVLHGYTEINAADKNNLELVRSFNVMSAPTLVVLKDGCAPEVYANASEIMGFVNGK